MIEFPNQPDFPEQHTAVAVGTINMSQQVDFDINVELACLKATLTVQANSNGSIATEALTGLNLALLSVYDMMKDVDRNMMLSGIRLESETSSEGRPFLFDNAYENINF